MATAALLRASGSDDEIDLLAADRAKPLLRFVTCGSVDDGKSTLIGRLLYDCQALFDDQVAALARESRRFGTRGGALDFALLVDGLAAEREQGITIDVAYRYFASANRKYIVADSPGHEQYTRNMVTAASTADLAILLVDATRGVTEQTRRHARVVQLLGVGQIVVAVNKMDLVGHDRARFEALVGEIAAVADEVGIARFTAVPVVAVWGGNLAHPSPAMPWYRGPTLVDLLETAPIGSADDAGGFVMPVQWVSRPDQRFRGFAGTLANGSVRRGDAVAVLPGGQRSSVVRIVTFDGDRDAATAGQAVTIVLADEIDCAAGSVIASASDAPTATQGATADLVWFDAQPLTIGRRFLLQLGATRVPARVTAIDGDAGDGALRLAMNDIARVRIETGGPIVAAPYAQSKALGAFVLIDRVTNATAAAGMVRELIADDTRVADAPTPIYAFAAGDPAAAAVAERLSASGIPATLLDSERLATLAPADPANASDFEAEAASWRQARALATLIAEAGVTVVLALDPPSGSERFGQSWPDDSAEGGSWII